MSVTLVDTLASMRERRAKVQDEMKALCEGRSAEEMSDEEISQVEGYCEDIDFLDHRIAAMERAAPMIGGAPVENSTPQRRSSPVSDDHRKAVAVRRDPTCGFSDLGDFTKAVAAAMGPRPRVDERLARMAPSTWSNEGSGGDGGYLVPPEFTTEVMQYVSAEGSLYNLCTKAQVSGNQLSWPMDEDPDWSTSGPQAYWEGEGHQGTQTKINLSSAGFRLNKLMVLCPVTEELMADAPQMAGYLSNVIGRRMRWKVDYSIMQGTGAGQFLGIINSPALVTVAKEGSQTADTINSTNIMKMYSRMYGDFRGNGVWVYNQDCETQLLQMVEAGTSSDVPVFLPSGPQGSSFAGSPYATLFGRPALAHQACETLGDEGDIFFCDFSQYIIGQKTAGPNISTSMELYFDYDMMAVKAVWRLVGMPRWSKTISARDGTATYSPFVDLAVRS